LFFFSMRLINIKEIIHKKRYKLVLKYIMEDYKGG